MKRNPLVSIIITNYNYGRFLPAAIDSVLQQTYPNKELIVVDDGSIDDSHEIIRSYNELIIPVLKENGGQASAFNAGYAASHGDLICFLDADDVWVPTKLAEVVAVATIDPKAVLIYHQVQNIDADGKLIGKEWPSVLFRGQINKRTVHSGGWWPYPPTSGLCFTRSVLDRIMDVPVEDYRICADAYLADVAPFLGPIVGIQKVLAFYRIHGQNQWNSESRLTEQKAAVESHLRMYRIRVSGLNAALERMGLNDRVSLKEHWPYHRLAYSLGKNGSLIQMTLLALRFPAEPRLSRRIKRAIQLWLSTLQRGI